MTIQDIITRKECQTFDCKSIQIDPKALAIPIIAFANADGGTIAIGVSDKARKIEGIDQHTEKLNKLLRVPLDFCNPSVSITSDLLPCTDKDGNENHILLREFGIILVCKQFQLPCLFHMHRQCLWLVVKEAVCCECREEVHHKIVYGTVA